MATQRIILNLKGRSLLACGPATFDKCGVGSILVNADRPRISLMINERRVLSRHVQIRANSLRFFCSIDHRAAAGDILIFTGNVSPLPPRASVHARDGARGSDGGAGESRTLDDRSTQTRRLPLD